MLNKLKNMFKRSSSCCAETVVLIAIESVRLELLQASKRGDLVEISEVHERLISLYAALNVHNVLTAIEHIDYKDVS
jgi:hypothetical protein